MRATVPFNTLEYMDELKASGMKEEIASAITKATAKAFVQSMETKEIVTKTDAKDLKIELVTEINANKIDILNSINDIKIDLTNKIHEVKIGVNNAINEAKVDLLKSGHENNWKIITILSAIQVLTITCFTFIQHFYR